MKKVIQAIMAVPISDTIGKSFGKDNLLGTGIALVSARVVLRSFFGMVVLGVVAGGLHYLQQHEGDEGKAKPAPSPPTNPTSSPYGHDDVAPASA